jgi:hypothetical protein
MPRRTYSESLCTYLSFINIVGFEVLTAVSMKIAVFWGNVGKLLPDYTVLQSRRQQSSFINMFPSHSTLAFETARLNNLSVSLCVNLNIWSDSHTTLLL